MIRIEKPDNPPPRLAQTGPPATVALCDDYEADPGGFRSGARTHDFNSAIYGHASVKQALLDAQHGKCCFCESKVRHVAHGDVEHFRPKGGFQQRVDGRFERPGYYWLAYDWSNLFFACQICNQSNKRNHFPLRRPTRRARSHHDNVAVEEPLLIDPAQRDPDRYIGFRQEIAFARRNSRDGRTTIELLQLNREPLVEARRDRLTVLRLLNDQRAALRTLAAEADARGSPSVEITDQLRRIDMALADAQGDIAEYAAMARALLA